MRHFTKCPCVLGSPHLQGVAVSDTFSAVSVFNATKTPACNSLIDENTSLAFFGRATSPSNVVLVKGVFDVQYNGGNITFINEASFDVWPVFTDAERQSSNQTVRITTLQTDFAAVDINNTFDFHTATDGWGPYHVSATSNGVNYLHQPVRFFPTFFVDSLVMESTE
ncbi:hypothetical protein J3F84DRAFT_395751 [Trichoderma pleuroticola]